MRDSQVGLPARRKQPWLPAVTLTLALTVLLAACATGLSREMARYDALRSALTARDYPRARELIRAHPETLDDRRAVSMAIALGDPQAVALFARQAGPNSELDLDGTTALLRSVTAAPVTAREEIVTVLLGLGADPRQADKHGTDAATLARRRGERRLLALMNRASGLRAQPSGIDAAPATARWMPHAGPVADPQPVASRGARGKSGSGRPTAATSRKPRIDTRAMTLPAWLLTDIWIAAPPDAPRGADVAGLRFHADGTGELLRIAPQRLTPQRQSDAHVAWSFEAGRLVFVVVSDLFAARCEAPAPTIGQLDLQCTDFTPANADDDDLVPTEHASLRKISAAMTQDQVRAMVDGLSSGTTLARGATIPAMLHRPASLACKPRMAARKRTAEIEMKPGARGDWYAFDSRHGIAYSALSGHACLQDESRRASLALCTHAGGRCVSVGGCKAGTVSAVAGTRAGGWAWVACAPAAQDARRAALAHCQQATGCDCQLLALSGANVMTQRGPECRTPPPSGSRAGRPAASR